MSIVDANMNEYCSKHLLEAFESHSEPDKHLVDNFVTSLSAIIADEASLGPNGSALFQFLKALYLRGDDKSLEGFDAGAVFGATKMVELLRSN